TSSGPGHAARSGGRMVDGDAPMRGELVQALPAGREFAQLKSAEPAAERTSLVDPAVLPEDHDIVAPRVRELFPQTLLWRPEVVTDDEGHASIDVDLADSITTWRLLASAVDTEGRLGATQTPLKVFQPFFVDVNLPVALTRGDEVTVPVVVSNYLDK